MYCEIDRTKNCCHTNDINCTMYSDADSMYADSIQQQINRKPISSHIGFEAEVEHLVDF